MSVLFLRSQNLAIRLQARLVQLNYYALFLLTFFMCLRIA